MSKLLATLYQPSIRHRVKILIIIEAKEPVFLYSLACRGLIWACRDPCRRTTDIPLSIVLAVILHRLLQSIRGATCHKLTQQRLTSVTNIRLVSMSRPVTSIPGHSQSACGMLPFLQYSRLLKVRGPHRRFDKFACRDSRTLVSSLSSSSKVGSWPVQSSYSGWQQHGWNSIRNSEKRCTI